ncbi:dna topoisomerase 2 [Quercus suber]|uniref:DNA topoisomerase 2 n=1 Tax=Quercus suber TaxID=58331 RepID=A0AAW0KIE1_QUESU
MGTKSEPVISKCKESENWSKVSFKPDLAKFNMTYLEDDVVALMKKRVFDLAGCLGKSVKVELNGTQFPIKSFTDYVNLYLDSAAKSKPDKPRSYRVKVNDRWEICVSLSDTQFQQVRFVNSIATTKGGTHVDYITNQITNHIMNFVDKKNKNANIKAHNVKNYLWVFVNALIDNPTFDSQTKEILTIRQSSFGSKCEVSQDVYESNSFSKSGIVDSLLSWATFEQSKDLKKSDGTKTEKIHGIQNLDDANKIGGKESDKCTLILTEGDSAEALALAGLAAVGRDYYSVFPLRGKLLNVREATAKQLTENKEIGYIKQILGLQQHKEYTNVKSLRYGHLMIMTDQATHKNGTQLLFYTMPEYESWKHNLGGSASGWSIKYYKGLGTSTSKEGREYFANLEKHRKDFIWEDEQDGEAIELAFSKKKIEERKN